MRLAVACSLLSLSVKLPPALVLDLSSPSAIRTFVYWLPWILTSIPDERRAQPPEVYLCFKYDAVLDTKDPTPWPYLDNILAGHSLAHIIFQSLDTIDNVPDLDLEVLLSCLLPTARAERVLRCWLSST